MLSRRPRGSATGSQAVNNNRQILAANTMNPSMKDQHYTAIPAAHWRCTGLNGKPIAKGLLFARRTKPGTLTVRLVGIGWVAGQLRSASG